MGCTSELRVACPAITRPDVFRLDAAMDKRSTNANRFVL
jgi:hypothetical protein